jgi:hypothetical protein
MGTKDSGNGYANQRLIRLRKEGVRRAVGLLLMRPVAAEAGGVVTNYTEADLRAASAVSRSDATGLNNLGRGNAGQPCRLLPSPDLSSWVPIATHQIGSDGTILFNVNCDPGGACRFYRLAMP